jgi:CheY-like chemotaxis protein
MIAHASHPPRRRLHLLIVDDEPGILRLFQAILRNDGHTADIAGSSSRALELMQHTRFDAVVSDLNMPGGGGLDLLRRVRGRYENIPFVAMTGRATRKVEDEARALGATSFLVKPVLPQTLREALAACCPERVA